MRGQQDIPMAIFYYKVPFKKGKAIEEKRVFTMKEDLILSNTSKLVELSQEIEKHNKVELAIAKTTKNRVEFITMKYISKPNTLPYEYVAPKPWWKRIFNF
tara:strand:+ start:6304 stop:6606 length:303 start_codon:yes stop_codon:yes gene_type:complete